MSSVSERIASLRAKMAEVGADWFFCTSDDFHGSEYVADYYKVREHYTGFTGENAFLTKTLPRCGPTADSLSRQRENSQVPA